MATILPQQWTLSEAYTIAQSLQTAAFDDVVAMAVLAILSAVYLGRGTLWDRPEPHLYKMYERPQEKMESSTVAAVSRDVSERMQQVVSDISPDRIIPESSLTLIQRTQTSLSSGVLNQVLQNVLQVDWRRRLSNVTARQHSSPTCRTTSQTLSLAFRQRSWPFLSCQPSAKVTPAITYTISGAGSSRSAVSR